MRAEDQARPAFRLEALDGLRALAALSVLAFHVGHATSLQRGVVAPLANVLNAGVTVFFVISGFVLYLPYARAMLAGESLPDWRRYAGRRAMRILPAYWVVLCVLALGPLSAGISGHGWWRYWGLAQIYDRHTVIGGLQVAWSLAVEISFYALLPLLAWGVCRRARRRRDGDPVRVQLWMIGALALISLVLRLLLSGSPIGEVPKSEIVPAISLLGFLDWFAIGMALAVLACEWRSGRRRMPRLAALADHPWCSWLLAAEFFAIVIVTHPGDVFVPQYGLVDHIALGCASGLVVLGVLGTGSGAPARSRALLAGPVMAWLGTISYGIYLWHVPVLETLYGPLAVFRTHPRGPLTVIGVLLLVAVVSIALGAASWYLVERPLQRWARRYGAAVTTPAGPPLADSPDVSNDGRSMRSTVGIRSRNSSAVSRKLIRGTR